LKNYKNILVGLLCLLFTSTTLAQAKEETLSFGFNGGGNKYWGEFTDNQFWLGGDLFLRYNVMENFSLHASVGLSQIRWKTTQADFDRYPEYFGEDAQIGDAYPNTNGLTQIAAKNSNRLLTYDLLASYNFFASEKFVPYLFGGIGLTNHEPRSGNTGYAGPLPNNLNDNIDKNLVTIPVGTGFEYYMTDNLVLNGRASFRFMNSDDLDDISSSRDIGATPSQDYALTYGIGLSYYILSDDDTDNDGLPNEKEEKIGTDPTVADSDGDNLYDGEEVKTFKTNPLAIDTDMDGLQDDVELFTTKTSPLIADTDSDKLNDGIEVSKNTDPNREDTDNDGLIDGEEVEKYGTDPLSPDTDKDDLFDGKEVKEYGSNPTAKDTDKDGLLDGLEVSYYNTNPSNPDTDKDNLEDYIEVNTYKTDPTSPDTDNDGLLDGNEVNKYKSKPLIVDTDKDGLTDGQEVNVYKTNPNNSDTDGDRLSDGDEVKIYFTDPSKADTDGDKVNDKNDKCPLMFGKIDGNGNRTGCPSYPKVGTKTDFPNILFKVDSDEFNYDVPETSRNLQKLLEYVKQCKNLSVMIEGHASLEGSKEYNRELSEKRAAKIKNWLISQGVAKDQIAGTIGYGEEEPKIQEPTGQELAKYSEAELESIREENRRITVEVVKTCRQGN
jgi:outer membrane protein OmpA-like peptidoglycan-associated protein/opacity protein-like surface antigen